MAGEGEYLRCKVWKSGSLLLGLLICTNTMILMVNSMRFSMDKLTPWQKATIKEMRRQVQDEVPHQYMDDDYYYAKWLASRNYHVDEAIDVMRKNFKWRKQNYMDSILKENWSQMEAEFPYQLDTVDKNGQPLLYIKMGSWNIGKMSNALRLNQLARYFAKIMEEADVRVRRKRASGRDVSQINVLVNMEGYSFRKHGCLHCFSFYSGLGNTLQAHYPKAAERIVFINAPVIFTVVFDSLQRMLNINDQQDMELFGTDRNRWEAAITNYVDRSQFPKDLADFRIFEPGNNTVALNA